jgi:hypothetical protein
MTTHKKAPQKKGASQKPDEQQAHQSHYDLFRGRFTWTDEPNWLRLVLSLAIVIAAVAVLFFLRQHLLPALGIRWLSGVKLPQARKWIHGRSP